MNSQFGLFQNPQRTNDFHERTHDSLTFNFFHKPWLCTIIGDLKMLITGQYVGIYPG